MSISYIYVIGVSENGPVKIGFSASPQKRLQNLQVSSIETLRILYSMAVKKENARIMERIIHDNNRIYKIRGEWYDLTLEKARAEIDWAFIRFDSDDENLGRKYDFGVA